MLNVLNYTILFLIITISKVKRYPFYKAGYLVNGQVVRVNGVFFSQL